MSCWWSSEWLEGTDGDLAKRFTDQYVVERKRQAESESESIPSNSVRRRTVDPALLVEDAIEHQMRRASSLLTIDDRTATDLAMRAIVVGISPELPRFLANLSIRDRASADRVFQAALERVSAEPQVVPRHLLLLAAYPFGENHVWMADGGRPNSVGFQGAPRFEVNTRQVVGFLRLSAAALSRVSEINAAQNPNLAERHNTAFFAARVLEPKVAEHDPTQLESWRTLISKLQTAAQQKTLADIEDTLREGPSKMWDHREISQEEFSAFIRDHIKASPDHAELTSGSRGTG